MVLVQLGRHYKAFDEHGAEKGNPLHKRCHLRWERT